MNPGVWHPRLAFPMDAMLLSKPQDGVLNLAGIGMAA